MVLIDHNVMCEYVHKIKIIP